MALDATYRAEGRRRQPRGEGARILSGRLSTELKPGEILTAIRIPPPAGHGYAYQKQKRKIGDYATAAAAVILDHVRRQGAAGGDRAHQCRRDAALCQRCRRPRWSAPRSMPRPISKPPSPPPRRSPAGRRTGAAPSISAEAIAGVMVRRAPSKRATRARVWQEEGIDGQDACGDDGQRRERSKPWPSRAHC